ncbi:ABC transporter ATP-binding protein [Dactylosporangium fulvum]|uniref:ABC transporter ATP-binding protein n=1 Tax=Dactylosporangium fulvum TaxID=53359 RepID=A0ABY5W9Q7_9ACTN|nr:ABC transporter ATP-binding protein [Dactylosporangium fulvum]UWP86748.1 ABC transporter ATP-binding protein [Dactylosporangium fulvum]
MTEPRQVLEVRGLRVTYRSRSGRVTAVDGAALTVTAGQITAVVGESGSGKTSTAHAVLGLLPSTGRVEAGSIRLRGQELVGLSRRAWQHIRGAQIGLVPQDPAVSLDPLTPIGRHVAEVLRIHGLATRATAPDRAVELLAEAGIPDAAARARQYPHELSGGLRQRVLIAMATAARPALLIADEPTSALDVTVQRQILDHLDALVSTGDLAILLVTHDLAVVAQRAQHVVVMSHGQVVEAGPTSDVLTDPRTDYTRRLIADAPGLRSRRLRPLAPAVPPAAEVPAPGPLLAVDHLSLSYPAHRIRGRDQPARFAVDDVSFTIPARTTLGLVGESGSGKTSLARLILGLTRPDAGRIRLDGRDITALRRRDLRTVHRRVQLIYQNPYASLNPYFTVDELVGEPLRNYGIGDRAGRSQRIGELLDSVALPAGIRRRRAAELSGGQRQRVAIARALALNPDLLVCDEPVSALDVTVQAQILQLLVDLQHRYGLTYLFISHDLAVVRQIADRVAVMRGGRLVEVATTDDIFAAPCHPYTRALLDAIPNQKDPSWNLD